MFIDGLCTTNEDVEYIYPKQLELKLAHQGKHVGFLDLDITIEDNVFAYKLFDKRGKLTNFVPKTIQLYTRKVTQGGKKVDKN